MKPVLVIGNKNYSSWSLRPWLALAEVDFDEVRLPLDTDEFRTRIGDYSPSGKVPVLRHDGNVVWESLAICEYAAETWPQAAQWPTSVPARAYARAACSQMHAGLGALRSELPMNIRRHFDSYPLSAAVRDDVEQVCALWRGCRVLADSDGPFLFGAFTITDAMFAPVVSRFSTYRVALDADAAAYVAALMAHPPMQRWCEAGRAESEVVEADEV